MMLANENVKHVERISELESSLRHEVAQTQTLRAQLLKVSTMECSG